MKQKSGFSCMLVLATFLCGLFLSVPDASAHRLNVFAWKDSDNVRVECNFGRNRPAMDTVVRVYDSATGKELLTGKTDADGQFVFRIPEGINSGLTIDANAGQGHHNSWQIDAGDLHAGAAGGAADKEAGAALPASGAGADMPGKSGTGNQETAEMQMGLANSSLSEQNLRLLVGEVVDKSQQPIREELTKIRHEFAAMKSSGPSMSDIIGGLGWIIGLVGIALYFIACRKS